MPLQRRAVALWAIALAAIAVHRCAHASNPSPAHPGAASGSAGSACTYDAISGPMRTPDCRPALADAGAATRTCCSALEGVLGPGANGSMVGCPCQEHVWMEVVRVAKKEGVQLEEILEACNTMHATEFTWYQGEGVGKCSEEKNVLATLQAVEDKKMKSFGEWVASLPDQPAVLVSFLFSIPFGAGAILFLFIASQALVL